MLIIGIVLVLLVVGVLIGRAVYKYVNRVEYVFTDNNGNEIILTEEEFNELLEKAKAKAKGGK